MPELILKLGDSVLQTFVFDKDIMSIGRSRDNDVVIENLSVSRNHGRVRRQGNKYILTDLNSANGTFVNGVRVSKTEIMDNDVIAIGKHKLIFANKAISEEEVIMDAFGADRTVMVERPEPMSAMLCVVEGKLKGREFPLSKGELSIGKAATNDVVLADDWFLQKRQAVITRRQDEYFIEDAGGLRKTRVNGRQLSGVVKLSNGDRIDFGNTGCVFQITGQPAEDDASRVPQELGLEDSIFSSGASDLQVVEPSPEAQEMLEAALPAQGPPTERELEPAIVSMEMLGEVQELPQPPEEEEQALDMNPEAEADEDQLQPVVASIRIPDEGPPVAKKKKKKHRRGGNNNSGNQHEEFVSASFNSQDLPAPADRDIGEMLLGGPDLDAAQAESEAPVLASGSNGSEPEQVLIEEASAEIDHVSFGPNESLDEIPALEYPPVQEQQPSEPLVRTAVNIEPEQEIAIWEAALKNKSAVIRNEAAKKLKKLTGRDYDV